MKNLLNLNLVLVGLPILLCVLGIIVGEVFFMWAALSTIFTGLFQLVIGFGMLFDEPKDKKLQWYTALVILFFIIAITSFFIKNGLEIIECALTLPLFLALYLTYIIYTKRNQ